MGYITLTELNANTNTNLSATHPVAYLDTIIDRVSDVVEGYCLGTLFETTTITDERRSQYVSGRTAQLVVKLKYAPLVSVTSLSYRIGSTDTTVDTSNADLDLVQGIIYLYFSGPLWRISVPLVIVVTYVAGHATIPDDVKMATALLVQEWVNADDQVADGSAYVTEFYQSGSYSERFTVHEASLGNLGLGTMNSMRATELLSKYRRPGVV